MKFVDDIHHRRSIRLKEYDYSQAGFYFVTICCDKRKCRFGRIERGKMILNEFGSIAHNEWIRLAERFACVKVDAFQIMPDHTHGIIAMIDPDVLADGVRAIPSVALNFSDLSVFSERRVTVGDIVGAYKSCVANACLEIYKSNYQTMGRLWQRNYWESIIRDEQHLFGVRRYIESNPRRWKRDTLGGGLDDQVSEPRTDYGEMVRTAFCVTRPPACCTQKLLGAEKDFLVEAPQHICEFVLREGGVGAFKVFFVGLGGFEQLITELITESDSESKAAFAHGFFQLKHLFVESFLAASLEGFADSLANINDALDADFSELNWIAHADKLKGGFEGR